MIIEWTDKALSDLSRLYEFILPANPTAAASVIQLLTAAPENLQNNPRLGEQLFQFENREVRRIWSGNYEIRYEIVDATISILRIWHSREQR